MFAGFEPELLCPYDPRIMLGRIDVHAHLLPGIDDGCKTVVDAIACARTLVSAGYTHAFCTPHNWPSLPANTASFIAQRTSDLQRVLDKASIRLKLLPGGELNLHAQLREMPADQLVTYSLAGQYVLVDLWAETLPDWFDDTIKWLQDKKLTVILAHPERMRAVQDNPTLCDRFDAMGVLLQGNLQCLADRPRSDTRLVAERFLREDRYFLLGSDTHNAEGLRTRMIGLKNAIALAGEQIVDALTRINPQRLLPTK